MGDNDGDVREEDVREDDVREEVRRHYALAAEALRTPGAADQAKGAPSCCGGSPDDGGVTGFGPGLYDAVTQGEVPVSALEASLGCGNPMLVAELHEGERVLDLGSGGGIDVLLSAKRVGPSGFAYGVDMTEEMLELARANADAAGAKNVEFVKGTIEDLPLPDESVDVVISNCVVNLSPDKRAVLAEAFRVLAPGGRIAISDVVATDGLSAAERAQRGSYVGCIAGALSTAEYDALLEGAGFVDIALEVTHEVAPDMHSALVRANKPGAPDGQGARDAERGQRDTSDAVEEAQSALDAAERTLDALARALASLDDATYGSCEVCGEAIAGVVLELDPTARRCAAHPEAAAGEPARAQGAPEAAGA